MSTDPARPVSTSDTGLFPVTIVGESIRRRTECRQNPADDRAVPPDHRNLARRHSQTRGTSAAAFRRSCKAVAPGRRSANKTTPLERSFQNSEQSPIISVSALSELASLCEKLVHSVQGGDPCPENRKSECPPVKIVAEDGCARSALESSECVSTRTDTSDTESGHQTAGHDTSRTKGGER